MLSNLAVSLFEHERIQTTEAKAKMLRPYAERLITKAKKGDVHNRRQVLSLIEDRDVVHKLFAEIAPRFSDRNGGYTRILKIGPRNGDGAPMALVELLDGETVERAEESSEETTSAPPRRRRGIRRGRGEDESPTAAGDVSEDVAETDLADADELETGIEEEAQAEEAAKGDAQETEDAETELAEEPSAEAGSDEAEGSEAEEKAGPEGTA